MSNDLWLNLPTKNIDRARKFFTDLGFAMNNAHTAPHMVSMFLGSNKVILNIFPEEMFRQFIGGHNVVDAKESNEVLFSLGASSTDEVDQWIAKAEKAGATIYGKPGYKDGWMYGAGFVDPDGHRWNLLYMDMSKLPKQ
jgi:predicted lactoylglutathione lyase